MTLLDNLIGFTDEHGQSIPPHMYEGLVEYIENHRPSGSFLMAVLRNDLNRAAQTADTMNSRNLRAYIYFLMEFAPHQCWGSKEKVDAWLKGEDLISDVEILPAGDYWIGDLCYVMHSDWSKMCDWFHSGTRKVGRGLGMAQLSEKVFIGFSGTAYGDGIYYDQYDKRYGVDAGLIGCISTEYLDTHNHEHDNKSLGHIKTFSRPFAVKYEDGVITFGDLITIDTN